MVSTLSVSSLAIVLLFGWGIGVLNVILFGMGSQEKFIFLMKVVPQLTCVVFVGGHLVGWLINGENGAFWGAMSATIFSILFTMLLKGYLVS